MRLLSVLLPVCAVWRGEASTLSPKLSLARNCYPPPEERPVGFLLFGQGFLNDRWKRRVNDVRIQTP